MPKTLPKLERKAWGVVLAAKGWIVWNNCKNPTPTRNAIWTFYMRADQIPRKSQRRRKNFDQKLGAPKVIYEAARIFFVSTDSSGKNPTSTQNAFSPKRSCNSSEFPPSCCLRKIIFIDHNYNIFLFQSRFSFHIFRQTKLMRWVTMERRIIDLNRCSPPF